MCLFSMATEVMCFVCFLDGFGRKKRANPVSPWRRRQEIWGGPTGRSRTSNIQISRDVAAKWSVFSDSRCAAVPSTVITARSITPCQREKCINTGYCRTPCLTHEWENYPVPSCCSTFILGGKQLLTRNHFSNHFEAFFLMCESLKSGDLMRPESTWPLSYNCVLRKRSLT